MKLLIIGSRNIKSFNLKPYIPPDTNLIISGGATGIDSIAEKYADDNRISKLILRPEYNIYGRIAPIKRNEMMIDMADEVLVIWDGESKGSQSAFRYAMKKGKKLCVIMLRKGQ